MIIFPNEAKIVKVFSLTWKNKIAKCNKRNKENVRCVCLCLSICETMNEMKIKMKTERVKRSELTYYLALEFMLSTYSQTCSMLILMLLHRLHLVYNVSKSTRSISTPYTFVITMSQAKRDRTWWKEEKKYRSKI